MTRAGGRVLDGIVHEVRERLLDARAVGADADGRLRLHDDLVRRLLPKGGRDTGRQLTAVDFLGSEFDLVGVEPARQRDRVEDALLRLALLDDLGEQPLPQGLVDRAAAVQQRLRGPVHRRERRTQLV